MSERYSMVYFESAKEITADHFGVVLKSSAIPNIADGNRDWTILDNVLASSGATSIRYPGGTEGWRDFDFTDKTDVDNLKTMINYCAKNNLSLQFTVSLRQFFVEPANSDDDGELHMSNSQKRALEKFVRVDLLDYAERQGVIISNIQLDNEPLHRDLDGEFLNHREYGTLANAYAEIIGPIIQNHVQDPSLSIVTASSEGRFNSTGVPVYNGAWGIRAILNGFIGNEGAEYIDAIDLHMGDVTLHPEYEDVFGTDLDSSDFLGTSLYDGLKWQMTSWKRDGASKFADIGMLNFQVSAWSLPQASDGGGSLQNAALAVLQIHSYSAAGVTSATNYTLIGGDANALFSFNGKGRAGGLAFGLMASSLNGLIAINLEPKVSNQERAESNFLIEGFLGVQKLVVYFVNRTNIATDYDLDFSDLVNEIRQFDDGISSISGKILGVVDGGDPTLAFTEAQIRNWNFNPFDFDGLTASFSLDAFEIIEFTIDTNSIAVSSPANGVVSTTESLSQNVFIDPTGETHGSAKNDTFVMDDSSGNVYGGAGIDTISFLGAARGVSVWTENGHVEVGMNVIEFQDVEKVQGTIFKDRIVFGGQGAYCYGEGGDDTFEFWDGSKNAAYGGAGNDLFLFYNLLDTYVSGGGDDDDFFLFFPPDLSDTSNIGRVSFYFANGDGNDKIWGFNALTDRFYLEGISPSQISIRQELENTIIEFDNKNSIALINFDAEINYDMFSFL